MRETEKYKILLIHSFDLLSIPNGGGLGFSVNTKQTCSSLHPAPNNFKPYEKNLWNI